ncbi:MAG: FadR/GntR family transcriptional regulator [Spirochaetaceae bacterium]|nr:FadR/GntR family transcriptional regulator [Spirochaetaceae bacterium]
MLEPVKKIRLYESIVNQIQHLILSGNLKSGEKLPPERELAEQLKVSRTSIREALRALEMMGFLESKVGTGGGTYVRTMSLDSIISPFSQVLLRNDEFIVELLELRLFLEIEVSRLAAMRRDQDDIDAMETAITTMRKDIESGGTGLKGDNDFHYTLAKAANNRVIQQLQNMCGNLLEVEREEHLRGSDEESLRALSQHERILEAIKLGDEELAGEIMSHHIHKISKFIKSNRNRQKLAVDSNTV